MFGVSSLLKIYPWIRRIRRRWQQPGINWVESLLMTGSGRVRLRSASENQKAKFIGGRCEPLCPLLLVRLGYCNIYTYNIYTQTHVIDSATSRGGHVGSFQRENYY